MEVKNKQLGEELYKHLKEKGVRFSYLAEKIGIPKQSLNAVFKGKRKITAIEYFKACHVLGVSADFFNPYAAE